MSLQAVVYNAKVENIPLLTSLGFDLQNDLISLDPADPNGYAWDMAADINDRQSILTFTEELIPLAASRHQNQEFWFTVARNILDAVIVSFRDAARHAGNEPTWTLRDLQQALATPEALADVLRHHDKPDDIRAYYFDGLSDAARLTICHTAYLHIAPLAEVAERWSMAQQRGRTISMKDWVKGCDRSVLVLPLAPTHEKPSFRPLNRAILGLLTRILLDETNEQPRQRYFFLENVGQAAEFEQLERLVAEGRSFGISVVLDPQLNGKGAEPA
ncbi:MAG: type IV secretion system DNA-binding domain-containing protein [Pirellulales bacterium]|nr:type IV secretion system DNA-binding domain-containing protein [Pirellulales bacterium]